VAIEDDGKFCCSRVEVERTDVVQQVEVVSFEKEDFGFRQAAARTLAIDVAAHGMEGSYLFEFFENGWFADVAEVKDVLDACERRQNFRAQKAVRIADDADLHWPKLKICDQIPF